MFHSSVLDNSNPFVPTFDFDVCRFTFVHMLEIYEYEAKKVFKDLKTHYFVKKPIAPKALAEHIENHLLKA